MQQHDQKNSVEAHIPIHEIPEELPLLPLRDIVIYPNVRLAVIIADSTSRQLIDTIAKESQLFGVVAQKSAESQTPLPDDLYAVGTIVQLIKTIQTPEGRTYAIIQGVARMRIEEYLQEMPYYIARIDLIHDILPADEHELSALMKNVKNLFQTIASLASYVSEEVLLFILNIDDPGILADILAENPGISIQERQDLLETPNVKSRLQRVATLLVREKQQLELSQHIQSQVQHEMDKTQREYYLRAQMHAIKQELGEERSPTSDLEELDQRIQETDLPEEAAEVAKKELDRLSKMHPAAAEYTVSRTYIDWILDLPWKISTADNIDVSTAEQVLEEDHYDLANVKKRILEYLAVQQLTQETKGPILCFVGPPGVGKTSLGRSIARALNRKFVRISLGGIRDEAEIRGHRRTYIGALPGRIIQGLKKAGSNNPVFMLDEIDKVGADFRGDPASALLEALDPEQNNSFADHYLEIPFDLSNVMFITTANIVTPIPPALLDRMEVLKITGYSEEEKLKIAEKYLIPRQIQAHGLSSEQITMEADTVSLLIRSYTREAGVRNLEREIASICRGVAKEIVDGESESVQVTPDVIPKYLGPVKFFTEVAERTAQTGVATGLARTKTGGQLLFIEATRMKGKEHLILTGKLGEVMKESAEIALSYVRSKAKELGLAENFFKNTDVHVHIPSGAIPKDGPSAGVTLYTSLVSLFSGIPVRSDTAMTGEVTLRGMVLPVEGVKEKVLAARRAGIKHVILPEKNAKDLEELPQHLKADLLFHFVNRMDEVVEFALHNTIAEPG